MDVLYEKAASSKISHIHSESYPVSRKSEKIAIFHFIINCRRLQMIPSVYMKCLIAFLFYRRCIKDVLAENIGDIY